MSAPLATIAYTSSLPVLSPLIAVQPDPFQGAMFWVLALPTSAWAHVLRDGIAQYPVDVSRATTGTSGGPYGAGQWIKVSYTLRIKSPRPVYWERPDVPGSRPAPAMPGAPARPQLSFTQPFSRSGANHN